VRCWRLFLALLCCRLELQRRLLETPERLLVPDPRPRIDQRAGHSVRCFSLASCEQTILHFGIEGRLPLLATSNDPRVTAQASCATARN
jgi:hypothetical protein